MSFVERTLRVEGLDVKQRSVKVHEATQAGRAHDRGAAAVPSSPDFFEVLGAIHESGVGVVVSASSFWDEGCMVRVQDALAGYETTRKFERLGDAGAWLIEIVRARYPQSDFAARVRDLGRTVRVPA